jgi:hypothetical protein
MPGPLSNRYVSQCARQALVPRLRVCPAFRAAREPPYENYEQGLPPNCAARRTRSAGAANICVERADNRKILFPTHAGEPFLLLPYFRTAGAATGFALSTEEDKTGIGSMSGCVSNSWTACTRRFSQAN